jgi:hypothetical protein
MGAMANGEGSGNLPRRRGMEARHLIGEVWLGSLLFTFYQLRLLLLTTPTTGHCDHAPPAFISAFYSGLRVPCVCGLISYLLFKLVMHPVSYLLMLILKLILLSLLRLNPTPDPTLDDRLYMIYTSILTTKLKQGRSLTQLTPLPATDMAATTHHTTLQDSSIA